MVLTGLAHTGVQYVAETMGWPYWATGVFAACSAVSMSLLLVTNRVESMVERIKINGHSLKKDSKDTEVSSEFRKFQFRYLLVYYVVMMADWLQGTNMYTLYQGYGVDVGSLFLTGFLSAAFFSLFVGVYVDAWGRKFGCIVYCFLEVVINICEHYNNFWLLWASRIMGGISTCLLFSAFETWMVAAHRKHGFKEEWTASTFSLMTVGNGVSAILAGFIAQVSADALGDIGPFQVAIFLTVVAWVLIALLWDENTGHDQEDERKKAGSDKEGDEPRQSNFRAAIAQATKGTVFCCSMSSALFEGAMYSFVFMWVPALQSVLKGAALPTGVVFSSFMVCVTIGGMVSKMLAAGDELDIVPLAKSGAAVYLVAAACMVFPVVMEMDFWCVMVAFLTLEAVIGCFFAVSGTLRSKYIDDATQCSVMNIFRVPLNLLVVAGTKLTDWYPLEKVFLFVSSWFFLAAVCLFCLPAAPKIKAE